jgi:OOP family OmpA-OmpF porin
MKKSLLLILFGLMAAVGTLSCDKDRDGEAVVSDKTAAPSTGTSMVTPVEAMTTQGIKVVFTGGEICWADSVVSFTPGEPAPGRSRDPKSAVGRPDYKGTDDAEDEVTYVSLGHGGELVLEFSDNVLVDGEGADLAVFEIGPEVEPILVAISEDGVNWLDDVGRLEGSTSVVDIGPFVGPGRRFRFVRLTDARTGKSNNSAWPGADVDAIGAIHTSPLVP